MAAGKFITFEGGEGAGKSTQIRLLASHLQRLGKSVLLTREPGGSQKAEAIRKILLEGRVERFGPFAEAMLFSIARDDHLNSLIRPALKKGQWVLSDRFMDSTRAYQGAGGELAPEIVRGLEKIVVGETRPDLTILIDLDPGIGLRRAGERLRQAGGGDSDRFEGMDLKFHQRLRQSFLDIAREEPERVKVVDGTQSPDKVAAHVWEMVRQKFSLEVPQTEQG